MPQQWTRALAIAAHPDDLEYGVAGAVAAWTAAGKDVRYLLVTRGEAGIDTLPPHECGGLREAEQRAAAAAVGVAQVEFLDHHDGVIEYGLDLRRDLAAAIRRHTPQLVVTTNLHDSWPGDGWNSPDHRHVGRAVLDAVADAGNRWIFPELLGLGLQPWAGVAYVAVGGSPRPTHAVDVTDSLDRAVASLSAHRTYLQALGQNPMASPREFLQWQADLVAPSFGGRRATAFELYRT
ncbi:PIG-L family deacetylase [Catellatospora sp. NEAU-YM18]|nr:PIG-L family deacetylase [Catellatospora tritici]